MYGYANQAAGSKGVWGFAGRGAGVYGQANRDGIAIRANGRLKADKVSGVATIPTGSTGVTIDPGVIVTGGPLALTFLIAGLLVGLQGSVCSLVVIERPAAVRADSCG